MDPATAGELSGTVVFDGAIFTTLELRPTDAPLRLQGVQWPTPHTAKADVGEGPANYAVYEGDGTIHVAWVTPLDGKDGAPLALYHATSRDGRAFTARTRVPSAPGASHVQLAATENGGMLLAWDEPADGGRRIRLARVEARPGSRASFTRLADVDATVGVYPSLAATTQGGVVAWVRRGRGRSRCGHAMPNSPIPGE